MSSLQEMRDSIRQAEEELRKADMNVEIMVDVIVGRLQSIRRPESPFRHSCNLSKLKKELRNFNGVTKQWNN